VTVQYHQLLCTKNQGQNHPCGKLVQLARQSGKTNMLFILRMMANIVQNLRSKTSDFTKQVTRDLFEEAQEEYTIFASHQEVLPFEQETVQCMKDILGPSHPCIPFISVELYRMLHGAILQNAQALNPVSDLHLYLNSLAPSEQRSLVARYDPLCQSPLDFVNSPFMKALCIMGSGLFLLANSMNHSCEPNVMSVSASNDYVTTVIALTTIKVGDELNISYINEDLCFTERQNLLKDLYLFTCTCSKCQREKSDSVHTT